jgi:hypothetical protein
MDGPTDSEKEKQDTALRARACALLEGGVLPRSKAARSWGGRGSGLPCALCGNAIAESGPEIELEFDGTASSPSLRFHLQCHSLWETLRRRTDEPDWIAIETRLPPFDTVVEARLSLSGSRSVILGIVRVRGRAGASEWLNATTNSALPASWRPLEWRQPAGIEPSVAEAAPKRA